MKVARRFVLTLVKNEFPAPHRMLLNLNPKGSLQEYTQHKYGCPPVYQVLSVSGPEHNPCYEVEVTVGDYKALGQGGSRRQAEFAAADGLLKIFAVKDPSVLDFGFKVGRMEEFADV